MDGFPANAVDVTQRLAEALPDFLPDWTCSRVYLVPAPPATAAAGARSRLARGGLPAGVLLQCLQYIERELAGSIPLHRLASQAGLSDCHFARAFKQSTGLPPHRYIMARRVQAALALIHGTDRALSQIALESGFCDQSHFSRAIAKATGHTPRALRWRAPGPVAHEASPALWPGKGRTTVRGRAGG